MQPDDGVQGGPVRARGGDEHQQDRERNRQRRAPVGTEPITLVAGNVRPSQLLAPT